MQVRWFGLVNETGWGGPVQDHSEIASWVRIDEYHLVSEPYWFGNSTG